MSKRSIYLLAVLAAILGICANAPNLLEYL